MINWQHRSQDRLLAGRICRTLLCLSRRRRSIDARELHALLVSVRQVLIDRLPDGAEPGAAIRRERGEERRKWKIFGTLRMSGFELGNLRASRPGCPFDQFPKVDIECLRDPQKSIQRRIPHTPLNVVNHLARYARTFRQAIDRQSLSNSLLAQQPCDFYRDDCTSVVVRHRETVTGSCLTRIFNNS